MDFFVPAKGAGTESRDSTLGGYARAALDEVTRCTLLWGKQSYAAFLPPGEGGSGQSPVFVL